MIGATISDGAYDEARVLLHITRVTKARDLVHNSKCQAPLRPELFLTWLPSRNRILPVFEEESNTSGVVGYVCTADTRFAHRPHRPPHPFTPHHDQ